jgi:hypothetical protein
MKRIHTFLGTGFIMAFVMMMPAMASAQLTPAGTGLTGAAEGSGLATDCTGTECVAQIIGGIIGAVLGFLGIILLAILIYAGFLWMTAGGDTDKVKRAKTTLINAVAGIIVVAASYAIASYVVTQLGTISGGGGGTSDTSDTSGAGGGGACAARGEACSSDGECCAGLTCPGVGGDRTCSESISL